ncbi:GTP cyclohydrolase I FolE2 [Streptomyces dengpaensis]|uniref:GTP cyclohydrolase FolE2 n=2 Tax=Streptomyces TaxID=1883 RepID=A0ABN5IEV2_9ACTN|nr:GTP cyclohydrolase I FolE2 [Streptomyces dengpaensis]PIB00265.1 GTP cyclohydrolase I FolE [Streptomyces sp. HG99]
MIPDVQSWPDDRGIGLDEVGITGVRYPVSVFDAGHGKQDTVAGVTLSVSLPPEKKGARLSRFVEVLDAHAGEVTPQTIPVILTALQDRLGSPAARLHLRFPYFLRRSAPVSGATAMMDYECGITASARGDDVRLAISARVPVTSVCPCSKAISDYGAHNQRSHITIEAEPAAGVGPAQAPVWLEGLITAAETTASSPVFPLLKRADERQVIMHGYDHPVFVEDMARGVTERLRADSWIARFTVEAASDESIHDHSAFARLSWPPHR